MGHPEPGASPAASPRAPARPRRSPKSLWQKCQMRWERPLAGRHRPHRPARAKLPQFRGERGGGTPKAPSCSGGRGHWGSAPCKESGDTLGSRGEVRWGLFLGSPSWVSPEPSQRQRAQGWAGVGCGDLCGGAGTCGSPGPAPARGGSRWRLRGRAPRRAQQRRGQGDRGLPGRGAAGPPGLGLPQGAGVTAAGLGGSAGQPELVLDARVGLLQQDLGGQGQS